MSRRKPLAGRAWFYARGYSDGTRRNSTPMSYRKLTGWAADAYGEGLAAALCARWRAAQPKLTRAWAAQPNPQLLAYIEDRVYRISNPPGWPKL